MNLLTRNECARIHEAALEVLRDVGVRVDDPGIVKLLQEAGATVTDEKVVHIPAQLVEWALKQCPGEARLADRRGNLWHLKPGGDSVVATGNALYVTRGRTRSELQAADLAELARVVDACEHIQGMVGTAVTDYPPPVRDFVGYRIMATHTTKHLRPCIFTPRGARLVNWPARSSSSAPRPPASRTCGSRPWAPPIRGSRCWPPPGGARWCLHRRQQGCFRPRTGWLCRCGPWQNHAPSCGRIFPSFPRFQAGRRQVPWWQTL